MENMEELEVEVFSKDFVPLGNLEQRTGVRFLQRFNNCGDFDLFAPLTENNTLLLKEENVIWFNKNVAGIIEQIEKTRNLNDDLQYHISGRTVASKIEGRTIYPMFSRKEEASKVICDLVNEFCINPKDPNRKIENLRLSTNNKVFGNVIEYRKTGGDLLEEVKNLCIANNIGFNIVFNPFNKTYDFEVLEPKNRTVNQPEPPKPIEPDKHTLLLIHGDSIEDVSMYKTNIINQGVEVKPFKSVLGDTSLYFNGSSQLVLPPNVFSGSTAQDFTIDLWAYRVGDMQAAYLLSSQKKGGFMFGLNGFGREAVALDGTYYGVPKNQWIHVAIVRKSGTISIYVNGKSVLNLKNNMNYSSLGSNICIGIQGQFLYGNNYSFTGYISEYRISDVARWDTDFTPPTEPYKPVPDPLLKPPFEKLEPIIFDSDNDQILTSDYLVNYANGKNVAIVAGEGEGTERIIVETTRDGKEISGSKRKELWVDARDLQRKNDDGFLMPLEDYKNLLKQRGLQKLAEYNFIENFESEIKNFGYQNFIFGKDYFLGDFVTVFDRELNVVVDKQITEKEETYDEKGYYNRLTFGEVQPTLKEIINRG